MRIINIVDNLLKVNFGIWNAAIATAAQLNEQYQVSSELWYPENPENVKLEPIQGLTLYVLKDISKKGIDAAVKERKLDANKDIIVTHGTWQYATKWGYQLKKRGFKWVYTPHGMLEPWSMQQKKVKKLTYFYLFEKRYAAKADAIRAVGSPEKENLLRHFEQVTLIPNGIDDAPPLTKKIEKQENPKIVLFMARLHHKKGVFSLVKGWVNSALIGRPDYKLIIAGPDDGEKERILKMMKHYRNNNLSYVGAVYGEEKKKLLESATYYILPTQSEGFPTSVVEAMGYGVVPIITDGCNFPEAFENQLAIKIEPHYQSIIDTLYLLPRKKQEELNELSIRCRQFILDNYTVSKIAQQQFELYQNLIKK